MPADRTDRRGASERRINLHITPEAKRMLRELGRARYPNLARPDGTVVEQLIREAYTRELGGPHGGTRASDAEQAPDRA